MAAFAACLLLGGCATEKKAEPDAWLQDKQMVMQSIAQLQEQQNKNEKSLARLEKKLAEYAATHRQQDSVDAEIQNQLVQIKAQIRRLRAAAEQLNASRKITKEKLDQKIEKIAQAIKPAEPVGQAVNKEEEKDHYTAAYLALKSGRYDEAIEKFRDLLKAYPNGGYSDQAYYWLGESYLAQNNTERAVGNLEWMVGHYPESTKHAAAMLRLGAAYQSQKRDDEATVVLKRLIETHADSPAAEEARKLLQPTPEAQNK